MVLEINKIKKRYLDPVGKIPLFFCYKVLQSDFISFNSSAPLANIKHYFDVTDLNVNILLQKRFFKIIFSLLKKIFLEV